MIEGVAPQAESTDPDTPFDPPGPFATQAFDCAMLIALAASIADSDSGANIAAVLPSISTSGQPCDTFVACAGAALEPRQIDYDGPSAADRHRQHGRSQPRPFRRVQLRRNGPATRGRQTILVRRVNGAQRMFVDEIEVADVEAAELAVQRRRPCRSASCTRRP